jgi:phosphoribosyl 1,2-cyclic phosphodiesterase
VKVLSIASASSGNATLISNNTTSILLDCGVPVKKILEKTGSKKVDALLISHEHGDHIKSAGAYGRKTKVPIYVNDLIVQDMPIFKNCNTINITDTSVLTIGSMQIKTFSTKHDARHALGFVFTDNDTKFCYLTDTGSISKTMREAIKDCNSYFIECDYDEELIQDFPEYSQELKDRITSNFGHLSTQQALDLVESLDIVRVKVILMGHLSSRTNSPEKVKERITAKFPSYVDKFIIAPFDGEIEV